MNKYILLVLISMSANALTIDDIKSKLRPIVTEYFGVDVANSIFGLEKKSVTLELPAIPKIVSNTKSTKVFNQKVETINLSKEDQNAYDFNFIREIIKVTRQVKPDDNEVNRWMNTLMQGASREGVYRAMVLDEYYGRLENYNQPLSQEAMQFTVKYLERFVGKKVKMESLQRMNIYTVKRIITEYSLDIMDIYMQEDRKEDFYTWYAVFSSELAQDFKIWGNKMRASSNANAHRKWAKGVPTQYVKSEVMIKLHSLLNLLQKRG